MKLISFVTIVLCIFSNSPENFAQQKSDMTIKTIRDSAYWKKVTPANFIDTLIHYGQNYLFRVEVMPPASWYKNKYIKRLKKHRNNNLYCASVFTPKADQFGDLFCGSTTISQEVNLLIEGIRKKWYPYYRSSSCYYNDAKKIE